MIGRHIPFLGFMISLVFGFNVLASELPAASPETVGLSSSKLSELTDHFQSYVDDGKLAGLTTLVARGGKVVHFEAYGQQVKENRTPMQKDTVFRIFSMTKPVTGVALMMLWEEGKFKLDDSVSKYLPSFKNQQVFVGADADGKFLTEPVKREATILDLMRHTAGLTYGYFGDTPVDRAYRASGLLGPENDLEALVNQLGVQPLLYQPGEAWVYSLGADVQGRLIEVLSGKTLAEFFEARIFKPLGMTDTAFQLRPEQSDRFAEVYGLDPEKGLTAYRGGFYLDHSKPPSFLSGGGGLVSTTPDYWRFAQMVANGGILDGVRLLKPETVAMMRRDQLPKALGGIAGGTRGLGFGLDFAVVKDVAKNGGAGRVGEFFWGGMANTLFWIDPEEELVVVFMTNIMPTGVFPLRNELRKYVYGALKD